MASVVNHPSNPFCNYAGGDDVLYIRYTGTANPPGVLRLWMEYDVNIIA